MPETQNENEIEDPSPATAAGDGPGTEVSRVAVTDAAADLLRTLYAANGPLMFHQSGGCCDGSSPMCYVEGEFRTGASDVLLSALKIDGVPEPVTFWMSTAQFATWRHTHLTVDVVPGRGGGFSLESPEGMRFLIRSRILTPEEIEVLDAEPVQTGAR
jgi:uncharacterized protein